MKKTEANKSRATVPLRVNEEKTQLIAAESENWHMGTITENILKI
jgi:hypothetical protein